MARINTSASVATQTPMLMKVFIALSLSVSAGAMTALGVSLVLTNPPTTNTAGVADEIHWSITGPTSVSFDWRGSASTIEYGTTTSYAAAVVGVTPSPLPISSSGPFWEARIADLAGNTLYHYSIGGGPDHTFKTAPAAGTSGFTVMAQADVGDAGTYLNVAAVQQLIANQRPDLVLMPGDLTYANAHGQATADRAFNDFMAWSNDAAFMPAWGNHEWDSPSSDDLRNYKGRFDLPNSKTSPGCGSASANNCGGEDWYWFDYGNTRFIAYPEPWSGALADWKAVATPLFDQAQADANIKFIVTFGHRPAYSSAHHPGESTLKGYLDNLGATHNKYVLNINGHSHNYERSYPQSGVIHITAGTGGSSLEQDGTCLYLGCAQPVWSAKRLMRQGALKLTFSTTGIKGDFLCGPNGGGTNDITCNVGDVIDTFTIGSVPNNDVTPPAISAITASNLTATSAQVAWTTDENATSQVEYGLTSTYSLATAVDTNLVTAHNQTLTGLTANTAYHYRVVSRDQATNTARSADLTFQTLAAGDGSSLRLVTDASRVFSVPDVSKPAYNVSLTDPVFSTAILRIAGDTGSSTAPVTGSWGTIARQHYSKDQPWNATQDLIALQNNASPSLVILDGSTYLPRANPCTTYSSGDDRWHPSVAHANERINVKGSTLEWYDMARCVQTRHWTLPFPAHDFGPSEGNASNDGRYIALANNAYTGADGSSHPADTEMIVLDMDPQSPRAPYPSFRVGPIARMDNCGLSSCALDWVSVSASGKYVVISYDGDHPRVFDVNPDSLALTTHAMPAISPECSGHNPADGYIYDLGHADFALNPFDSNEDVLVGQRRSWCPQTVGNVALGSVVMVRLRDNSVTSLTTPANEATARHISTRNLARPGWAYVTYDPGDGKRFGNEIIAVKLDGSGSVERYTHHHSSWSGCYKCESHAVPSPDGLRIIFASTWSANCGTAATCGTGSDVKAYIVDARSTPVNVCTPNWQCTAWSTCTVNGQNRICTDANNCGVLTGKPAEQQTCTVADTTPPQVSLTRPTAGQALTGIVGFEANATDDRDVNVGVQFKVDGQYVGTRLQTQNHVAVYYWDSRLVANGSHTVVAQAWDSSNNTASSSTVTVSVSNAAACTPNWQCTTWTTCSGGLQTRSCTDNNNCGVQTGKPAEQQSCTVADTRPPVVTLTSPVASQTITGTVEFGAFATGNTSTNVWVQFMVDGHYVGTIMADRPYYQLWDSRTVLNGSHTVAAVAWDESNNTATSAAATVTVANTSVSPVGSAQGVIAADTYLRNDSVNSNYGRATTMNVDGLPVRDLLIRFTVGDLGGKAVTGAKLRLHTRSDGSSVSAGSAYRVPNSNWNENAVTWSNAPAVDGAAMDTLGGIGTNSWAEFNLASMVNGPGTYTVRIKSTSSDGVTYDTRESTTAANVPIISLSLMSTPIVTTPLSFVPVEDTYLAGTSGTNYGTKSVLYVDGNPTREALLKFTVSGLGPTTVQRAVLRLHAESDGSRSGGGLVYGITNSWTEKTANGKNSPKATRTAVTGRSSAVPNSWVDFDVTSLVTGDGTVSFRVKGQAADGVTYSSKEAKGGIFAPQLVIYR